MDNEEAKDREVKSGATNQDIPEIVFKRLSELIIVMIIVFGLVALIGSFFTVGEMRNIARGIGLSLVPAGLVAALLARYGGEVTRISIDKTIKGHVDRLDALLTSMSHKVENSVSDHADKLDELLITLSERAEKTISQSLEMQSSYLREQVPFLTSAFQLGVENVYLTRTDALEDFADFIGKEIENGTCGRVWIVCSSMKGFLTAATARFNGTEVMRKIVESSCDCRILMTDRKFADLRASQEKRGKGHIPAEIKSNLLSLKQIGTSLERIKYYKGTPTVFGIATSNRMLLNPYPYQAEAYKCFSIRVRATGHDSQDIFHQYLAKHFEEPWEKGVNVSPQEWDKLEVEHAH